MCPTTELGNKRQGHMKPDTQQGGAWLVKTLTDALKFNSPQSLLLLPIYETEWFKPHVLYSDHDLQDKKLTNKIKLTSLGQLGEELAVLCLHHASKFTNTPWDIQHIWEIRFSRAACFVGEANKKRHLFTSKMFRA